MACELDAAIQEIREYLMSKPAMAGYDSVKGYLTNLSALSERLESMKLQTPDYTYSIVEGIKSSVPKDYYKTLNKLVKTIIGPKVTTSQYLAFSEASLDNLAVIAGKHHKGVITLSKTPRRDALEAQARGMLETWYVKDSEYKNVYEALEPQEYVNALEKDTKIQAALGKNLEPLQAKMLAETAKINGAHTFAHEMVHAGAKEFMRENPNHDYTKRIHEMYQLALDNKESVRGWATRSPHTKMRWETNVDEFIAEGLSNPDVIYALHHVKVEGKPKNFNMFKQVLQSLLGMLGVTRDDTVYVYLLDGYLAMLKAAKLAGDMESADMVDRMSNELKSEEDMNPIYVKTDSLKYLKEVETAKDELDNIICKD